MIVGLHDADKNKFPNYALMKISAWHKARGDYVDARPVKDNTERMMRKCLSVNRAKTVDILAHCYIAAT